MRRAARLRAFKALCVTAACCLAWAARAGVPTLDNPEPLPPANGMALDTRDIEDHFLFIGKQTFSYSAAGRSVAVTRYRYRKDSDAYLSLFPWFDVWRRASRDFATSFDKARDASVSAGSGINLMIPMAPLRAKGSLGVTCDVEGAAVYLNTVFIGLAPLEQVVLPVDTYLVKAVSDGRVAEATAVVEFAKTSKVRFRKADFAPTDAPSPTAGSRKGDLAWWRDLDEKDAAGIYATPRGAIVFVDGPDPLFRFHEGSAGSPLWETPIGLRPTSPPVVLEGKIWWGAPDGFLHSLDPATGAAEMVLPLRGTMEIPPCLAGGAIVCAAWDEVRGGSLRALDREGKELWASPVSGRPIRLLALAGVVMVAAREPGLDTAMLSAVGAADGSLLWSKAIVNPDRMLLAGEGKALFVWGGKDDEPGWLFADAAVEGNVLEVRPEGEALLCDGIIHVGRLILAADSGTVYAVDIARRDVSWMRSFSPATVKAGRLVPVSQAFLALAPGREGNAGQASSGPLYLISSATGQVKDARRAPSRVRPLAVAGERIIIRESRGGIIVRDLDRDYVPFRFPTPPGIVPLESPILAAQESRGYLLLPKTGRLYAFDLGFATKPSPAAAPAVDAHR